MTEQALRYNTGKPEYSYLLDLPHALEALIRVYEQGAIKYARGNWKKGGKPDGEYLDSALRHMFSHANEGHYDTDIGTVHIANAVWNLLALIELNMKDVPALDPEFDQDAFLEKYGKEETPTKTVSFFEGMFRPGVEVNGSRVAVGGFKPDGYLPGALLGRVSYNDIPGYEEDAIEPIELEED